MSDFFIPNTDDKDYWNKKKQNLSAQQNQTQAQPDNDYWQKKAEPILQQKKEHYENWNRYGIDVPDEYYEVFNKMIPKDGTPEEAQEEAYRIGSAYKYMQLMGCSFEEAYSNVDAWNEAQFTDLQGQKPRYEALADMVTLGHNNVKLGKLGQDLMAAQMNGDEELTNALMAQIDAINQRNTLLQDNTPRKWVMQALEAGAQSLPFTGYVAAAGIFGNFIAPGVGTAASFAASSYLSAGQEYIDMLANGASPRTARIVASVSGGIQGLIEADLGITKGIVKGAGKLMGKEVAENTARKAVEEIGRKVAKRFHFGPAKKLLVNYLAEYGMDVLGEGVEEFLQELTSIAGQEIAASLDGYDIPDDDFNSIVKQTTEAFKGGVLGALALGFVPAGLNAKASIKEYRFIKDEAEEVDSPEAFYNKVKDSPVFGDMTEGTKKEVAHDIWEKAQQRKEAEAEFEAKQIAEGLDAGEGAEERKVTYDENGNEIEEETEQSVARDDTGRLISKNEVYTDENGNETGGTFRVGDTSKSDKEGNRYGYIKYSTDENGDITIDTFKMTEGREGLREELFDEFARQHPDVNIEWNPSGSVWQDAKQKLIDENPNGSKNGLNYYTSESLNDIQTKKDLGRAIREKFHNVKAVRYFDENNQAKIRYEKTQLTSGQVASVVALFDTMAQKNKQSLSAFLDQKFVKGVFGTTSEMQADVRAYNQEHIGEQVDENKVTGGFIWKNVEQGTRAIIYAAENADYLTLMHELAHFYQSTLTGELKAEAEAAFGVIDGDWSAQSKWKGDNGKYMSKYEAFAYHFQDWLTTGRVKNETWKNVFEKFAQFLAQAYTRLKNHLTFTPEIESVFEKMLGDDKSIMAKALKAAQEEEGEYRAMLKRDAEAKEAQKKAEAEEAKRQAEAEREEASEGTDFEEGTEDESPEELEKKLDEATNENKEETNAIDDALENLNLTDDKKAEIAEVLKDETSTVVEKAEAATEAASSVYDVDDEDLKSANKLYTSKAINIQNVITESGKTGKELRKLAIEEYNKLENTPTSDGKMVEFSGKGRKEIISHSADETVLKCTPQLPELIKTATYLFSELPDQATQQDTLMFYNYGAKIILNSEEQLLRITIRETKAHEFFYDAHNTRIEDIKRRLSSNNSDRLAMPDDVDKSLTKDKLYQWLKSVKQKYQEDMLFQIAGEIGAENLDNSEVQEGVSRMQNLAIAKEMEESGKNAQEIRLATGWEKGTDGKWKYEIDDGLFSRPQVGTKFETIDGKTVQVPRLQNEDYLREFYKNDELYKAYPELANVWVSFKKFPEGTSGNTYTYNSNIHIEVNENDSVEEQKKTLVHEIQHIIQHVEGFAKGGSMERAAKYIDEQNNARKEIRNKALAWEWKKELEEEEQKHPELRGQTKLMDALIDEYKEDGYDLARLEKEGWVPSQDIRYKGFNLYVRGYDKEGFEDAYNEWSKGNTANYRAKPNTKISQYFTYKRFGGEVESRNVESRMNFTPEERREALLAATEDVARDDQIMLFQTVYHGSSADFDKFDTENYGLSGEGSMSFGYGTYLTDSEEIARDYAERQRKILEKDADNPYERDSLEYEMFEDLRSFDFDKERYKEYLLKESENIKKDKDNPYQDFKADNKLALLDNINSTNLYTVEIPDNGFILWDEDVDTKTVERVKKAVFKKLTTEPDDDGEYPYKGVERELQEELNDAFDGSLTGQTLYNNVAIYAGSEKNASKLLNKIGFTGINYPAYSNFGNAMGKTARNFVIFNDDDAKIIDHMLFQTQAELMDEARTFETWQEFMEYCEAPDTFTTVEGNPDAAWYKAFWEQANAITQEEEKQTENEERQQEAEADTPEMVDRLFISYIRNNPDVVDNFVQAVAEIAGQDLGSYEWANVDEEGGRERERYVVLQDYINAELSDGNWQTAIAKVLGGNELTDYIRKRLVTEMTDAYKARDFRNLYSIVMKDKNYAVDALDTRAAELERKLEKYSKRYYDIVAPTEDVTVTTPQRRKEIAQEMQNRDMAARIKAGSLKVDDEVYNYLKSVEKKEKDLKKQEQQLTDKIQNLYQDVGNTGLQLLINTHEKLMEQKARLNNRNADTQRKIDKGLRMTDRYTRQTQDMTQTYHELERKFSDLKDSMIITDEVQQILDTQEQRREIREEVARLTKERYLADETKKIRINLVKSLFRKVDLSKVDFKQAQLIIAIQKLTMPNMIGGVNRWIGRNSPFLNAVLSRIVTDSEYKERIVNYLEHVEKQTDTFHDFVESIRNAKSREDFESWGVAEREYAIKYLPKENWVWELKLNEKARELQESLHLDITQEKVERQVYDADGHPVEDDEGNPVMETAYQFKIGDEALNKLLQETLGDELFNRLMNSPMVEWSTQEMEELVARVNQIRDEGITMRAAKIEARKREAQKFMQQIADAIKDTGITINEGDTPEEKEKKLNKINKILGKNKNLKGTEAGKESGFIAKLNRIIHGYKDANVLRVGRILDNQSEGVNTYLLYRKEDECYNKKLRSIMSRGEVVNKVMAANKINEGELAKSITIDALGTKFTVDELLFFLAADKDFQLDEYGNNDNYAATSRNAVCYGNMMSDTASQELKEAWAKLDADMNQAIEKDLLTPEQRQLLSDKQLDTRPGTTAYINECNRRWDIVIKAANDFLEKNPGYNALLEAIQADYADQYERMNEVSINEFNVGVNRVKCYVPLVRREQNGGTNENQVMEDLLAINGVGKSGVNKGMTQSRTSISPLHQRPVQTGLFRTWCDSVERTEHFIAYAPYVRLLNRVYNSRDAQYLRSDIEGRYGKGMLDYIDAYISEVANPNAQNTRSTGAELLHILRGKTAPAYLGWKASAIIKQGLTSPWPYMQFVNPAEYLAACFKCNNPKMWEAIQEKSVFMKNRRMDPINDLVDEMSKNAKNKVDKFWSNFTKIGMQGLEFIDWACVAPGWYACYTKKYNQLQKASEARYNAKMAELEERNKSGNGELLNPTQMETIARQEMLEDIEVEAITYADDCTRQCQPSNRLTDLAPLFKDKNEFMRAFLQFQTSLNVIWQNIRYDLPYAVKQKEFKRIAGTVIGYIMAGIFMNSVMDGVRGDDDDDDTQALRNLIYYSTTQFTDAIPIMGSEFTNAMDKIITGKRAYAQSGTDMTPSATKLLNALQKATSGDFKKAASLTAEGIGLFMGAPVSGTKEIYKLLGKPLEEGNDVDLKRGISDVYGIASDIIGE